MKYQKPYAVNLGDRLPKVMGACNSGVLASEQSGPGLNNCSPTGNIASGGNCGAGSTASETCTKNGANAANNCNPGQFPGK